MRVIINFVFSRIECLFTSVELFSSRHNDQHKANWYFRDIVREKQKTEEEIKCICFFQTHVNLFCMSKQGPYTINNPHARNYWQRGQKKSSIFWTCVNWYIKIKIVVECLKKWLTKELGPPKWTRRRNFRFGPSVNFCSKYF